MEGTGPKGLLSESLNVLSLPWDSLLPDGSTDTSTRSPSGEPLPLDAGLLAVGGGRSLEGGTTEAGEELPAEAWPASGKGEAAWWTAGGRSPTKVWRPLLRH